MKTFIQFLIIFAIINLVGCINKPAITSAHVPEQLPKPRVISKPNVALVLGGGGARGMAHLGVLSVLQEHNIPIDLIVGTSIGSIVGALYADHPDSRYLYKTFINTKQTDMVSFKLAVSGGFSTGLELEQFMEKHLSVRNFKDLKIPFIAVTTDLNTGDSFIIRSGLISPAVHASSAIAGVFVPVPIYGRRLIDGGFTQPIPVAVARQLKSKVVIAVNIEKQLSNTYKLELFSIINRSIDIVTKSLGKTSLGLADIVIRPQVKQIGTFDDKSNKLLYNLGRQAALEQLPAIKKLLAAKHIH